MSSSSKMEKEFAKNAIKFQQKRTCVRTRVTHMSETRKEAEAEAEESSSSVGGWGFSLPSIELPTDLSSLTDTLSSAVRELETKADEAYSQMKGMTDEAMKNTLEQAEMMAEEEEKEKNKGKCESRGDTRQEIEEEKEAEEEEEKRRREEKAMKQKEEAKKKLNAAKEQKKRKEEEEEKAAAEAAAVKEEKKKKKKNDKKASPVVDTKKKPAVVVPSSSTSQSNNNNNSSSSSSSAATATAAAAAATTTAVDKDTNVEGTAATAELLREFETLKAKHLEQSKELEMTKQALASREETLKRKNEADAELKRQDASEALKLEQEMKDRVAQAERKVLALTKERDTLKKSFEKNRAVSDLVKEKDKIIDEVMKEGEVLSKKQSEMEGTIKKLKATIREKDEEMEERNNEFVRVQENLKVAEMNNRELTTDLEEKNQYFSDKLAEARRETADLSITNSGKAKLEQELSEAKEREFNLVELKKDLEHTLKRNTLQYERQEERLKRDLIEVEERCRIAEEKLEEMTRKMPESTRPLLKQIESNEKLMDEKTNEWREVEAVLFARIEQAESAIEEEKTLKLEAIEMCEKIKADLKAYKTKVVQKDEEIRKIKDEYGEMKTQHEEESEAQKAVLQNIAEKEAKREEREKEIKEQMKQLRNLLAEERAKVEKIDRTLNEERDRFEESVKSLEEKLRQANAKLAELRGHGGGSGSNGDGIAGNGEGGSTTAKSQQSNSKGGPSMWTVPTTLDALSSFGEGSSLQVQQILENAHRQLQARTEQLELANTKIKRLEATRDALSEELTAYLLSEDESYFQSHGQTSLKDLADAQLREEFTETEKRYNVVLELLGEKDEEIEDLKDNIASLKDLVNNLSLQNADDA